MTQNEMVMEFHKAFNHPINKEPDRKEIDLRINLIAEEAQEAETDMCDLWDLKDPNYIDTEKEVSEAKKRLTKELADILYVVWGTAISFGLPLEEVFKRVHESNMSKLGEDGKPIYREDGKVLKGPNYKPVNLEDLF